MSLIDGIISAESGGRANAKNPRSSATGLGQFIDSTWLAMIAKHRPDLAGLPKADALALRNDPSLSRQMTQAYADDNSAVLRSAGLPTTPGNVYLAHFAGPAGARSVLAADPGAPVSSLLPSASISANPFLRGMSAGDLTDWAARKVGGSAPAMSMPASAGPAAQSGRFGVSGVEASTAPAPTMVTPSEPAAEKQTDVLALIAPLLQSGSQAASPQAVQAQVAPRQAQQMAPAAPVAFDASRFWSLLKR